MKLESCVFGSNQPIPKKYTGEGKDTSPPLAFSDVPVQTKSLVVVVDDPDAPKGIFDHWLTWNIAPHTQQLLEGDKGPVEGMNHFGEVGYRGPMPPPGKPHRYIFKLYALDCLLPLKAGADKRRLEEAMRGHVLAEAQLVGIYQR